MDISKEEYFFYEWLIITKNISEEDFKKLTCEEFKKLKLEYLKLQ